jgi:phosphohistidine phosphatase
MAIYLARHGEALSVEKNPERPLSKEGRYEIEKIAELLKKQDLKIGQIIHSGKKRAEETAQIFSSKIGDGKISSIKELSPNDNVESFWKNVQSNDDIMYVGHLPFMEKLVSYIITGDKNDTIVKIKTAGVICLEKGQDIWYIKWAISPNF